MRHIYRQNAAGGEGEAEVGVSVAVHLSNFRIRAFHSGARLSPPGLSDEITAWKVVDIKSEFHKYEPGSHPQMTCHLLSPRMRTSVN